VASRPGPRPKLAANSRAIDFCIDCIPMCPQFGLLLVLRRFGGLRVDIPCAQAAAARDLEQFSSLGKEFQSKTMFPYMICEKNAKPYTNHICCREVHMAFIVIVSNVRAGNDGPSCCSGVVRALSWQVCRTGSVVRALSGHCPGKGCCCPGGACVSIFQSFTCFCNTCLLF